MILDWDDAYRNGAYIEGAAAYPGRWLAEAEAYRRRMLAAGRAECDIAYGPSPRHRLDLFQPSGAPRGLVVFVHGGYWLDFDKSSWSHFASGAVAAGWAVAMPSYRLAPEVSVAAIARDVGQAIEHAARLVSGPIRLTGHSAGGHLVTRLGCVGAPLDRSVQERLERIVSISGVHDLRPLLKTAMGPKLFADPLEAARESPALLEPATAARVICWVGAGERPEFLRQSDLLANIWHGLGVETQSIHEPGRHHFDVIDGLTDAASPLGRALVQA